MARETAHRTLKTTRPADDIWHLASDFAAPWHPMVSWMQSEDAAPGQIIRRFGVHGDEAIYRERLTYLSHSDHTLSYTALSGIEGASRYDARLKLTSEDKKTLISWHAEIEASAQRAAAIAKGTAAVFDAGLNTLAGASPGAQMAEPQPAPCATSEIILGDTPRLGLTLAPEGVQQAGTMALFLHGIGGNRGNWHGQLAALGHLMPMAALDLRGYGDSTLGFAQSQLDDYFDDILAVMDHFGAQKLVLCGLSYGAWIGASFALRHPQRIAGLVLCGGCTGMSEADPDEREAFRISREVPLDAGQTPADFAASVVDVIAGPQADHDTRAALTASMAAIPAETYRDALNCFTNPLERLNFSRTSFPVLLMTGEHDRLAPPAEIRAVSHRFADGDAPFVQFEVIEGAGHVCNLERPDVVNGHLAAFLRMFDAAPATRAGKKAEKHARILDAALAEFSQNGYSGASMQRIAEGAGVSKPTLYQYIGQKEDIFRAVLDQGSATILAPFARAADGELVPVLWDFAWAYADYVLRPDNLSIARLMIGEAARVPEVVRQFQQNGPDRALAGIAQYLEAQAQAGNLVISDAETAAEHLWSLILSGPRNRALHNPQNLPDKSVVAGSITDGLRVFLKAYAADVAGTLSSLENLAAPPPA